MDNPNADGTVFLTDGQIFLGPYLPGTFDLARGTRALREVHGAAEVHAMRAGDLLEAKRKWRASLT